jgi:hypothetical protein
LFDLGAVFALGLGVTFILLELSFEFEGFKDLDVSGLVGDPESKSEREREGGGKPSCRYG